MEMLNVFFCALISGSFLAVLVQAQDQSGFISIDCGLSAASTYNDARTGVKYVSDATFIDSGLSKSISPQFQTNTIEQQFYSVRSFPEGVRNCYSITPPQGRYNKYLIRARFMYGNYDDQSKPPEFDLHLGVNLWDSIKIENESLIVTKEIMHVFPSTSIYICLVNKGLGTPFVSTLELRHFRNSTYPTPFEALTLFERLNVGPLTDESIRYKDDVYDRIWKPSIFPNSKILNTSHAIDVGDNNGYRPASVVMSTAHVPIDPSERVGFNWEPTDPTAKYYVYMHFAELEELKENEIREFNITRNGERFYGPVVPSYLYTNTLYTTEPVSGNYIEFWLERTNRSTLPPILNALEIFMVKDFSQSPTDPKDVDAIMDIKSTYGVKKNWQGDPCAPKAYSWDGLNCSYDGSDPPRIISLNLSSSELNGKIAASISNLAMLQHLDLSNNSLTGDVPAFLSQTPLLSVLNLEKNKLSGSLPVELLKRSNNGSLLLSIGENPDLCPTASCQKKEKQKNKLVVPVAASAATVFFILAALAVSWWCLIRRKQEVVTKVSVEDESKGETTLESKNRKFTHAEVLKMTRNFETVLGRGGFGSVFLGCLDKTPVAVKMLSESSVQGSKEFRAEVKLLMRVHHGNLTSLVGYCNEGSHMGLIYEYMANGNLKQHLSDRNAHTMIWEERLRIAIDAAQGLEYLHYGSNPPIVHRDVKSANILLNENFQAKLADFGLSRAFPTEGGTHVSTVVAGTLGYLDPEYQITNRLNEKSDVYSFGVVLLEIVTSKSVVTISNNEATHISQWVNCLVVKGEIKGIVDPRLGGDFEINSAWKVVELALRCVSRNSIERPTMSEVVMELKECLRTEVARKRGGPFRRTGGRRDGISINLDTESNPSAR